MAGFAFSSDVAITVGGCWFWESDNGAVATDLGGRLFTQAGALVASGTLPQADIEVAAWNWVPFDTPHTLTPAATYKAAVWMGNPISFIDPSGVPFADPTGHVTVTQGLFGGSDSAPNDAWSGIHAVDIGFQL